MSLRNVQVFRAEKWIVIPLNLVQAGEKVKINVEGTVVIGYAHSDGFLYSPGVGAVQLVTDLFFENVGAANGKTTQ
jgi:hypothetical protein